MRLQFGDETATLDIIDDGRGFASELVGTSHERATGAPFARNGYGLQSMMERLQLVGGDLLIESTPGVGTSLHISVPRRSAVQAGQSIAAAPVVMVPAESGT
jgi:signal transduction histidine kinase